MGKLHELLAVEGDLEGTFKSILQETWNTFAKKPGLFMGQTRKLKMFADEGDEQGIEEITELSTTVKEKMDYMAGHVIKYFDILLQKEATNQLAKADLIVNGVTIAKDLPATFLLGMETRLKRLRDTLIAMPTLPYGKKWVPAPELGEGVFACETPDEKYKTAKTFQHKVLYQATKEHPAQIEKWEETENIGKYITDVWSGMVSSAQKSEYIGKIDALIQGFKQARQRANTQEVEKRTIGKEIFEYLG